MMKTMMMMMMKMKMMRMMRMMMRRLRRTGLLYLLRDGVKTKREIDSYFWEWKKERNERKETKQWVRKGNETRTSSGVYLQQEGTRKIKKTNKK
jgi:hypothetical protein